MVVSECRLASESRLKDVASFADLARLGVTLSADREIKVYIPANSQEAGGTDHGRRDRNRTGALRRIWAR
jgi:hypothetical protein